MLCMLRSLAQSPVINEVHRGVARDTTDQDGVELLLGAERAKLRSGLSLVLGDQRAILSPGPAIGSTAFVVFKLGNGPGDLPLHLPPEGGTLLLVDADGATILDLFTFPELPEGTSVGRLPDGARQWSYFTPGTLGRAAPEGSPLQRIAGAPELSMSGSGPVLRGPSGSWVMVTCDGSPPGLRDTIPSPAPLQVPPHAVLRARAAAPGAIAGPEVVLVTDAEEERSFVALTMDPDDLNDPERGINVEGLHANFSKRGRAWERRALLTLRSGGNERTLPVVVRISGSGTRGLPKRSFHVALADTMSGPITTPDGRVWTRIILRSDATMHAALNNMVAEELVHRAGDRVDIGPSTIMPLYLNGRYWGAYRVMPTKGKDLIRRLDPAEDHDIIEGPAGRVVTGDRIHFQTAMAALREGRPVAEMEELIDVGSLIDLACFDLYSGRADHDLNMRCWRPRTPDGRWRWILYDMDLWAPPSDHVLDRMCEGLFPSSPFLPQILGLPELRDRLLARMTVLLGTVFSPESVATLADGLGERWRDQLERDRERWQDQMDRPDPMTTVARLQAIARTRPGILLEDLSRRTGMSIRTIRIDAPPADAARLMVEGVVVPPGGLELRVFAGVPLELDLEVAPGFEADGWKGIPLRGTHIRVRPEEVRHVRPLLRVLGS